MRTAGLRKGRRQCRAQWAEVQGRQAAQAREGSFRTGIHYVSIPTVKPKKKRTGHVIWELFDQMNTFLFCASYKQVSAFVLQRTGRRKDAGSAPSRLRSEVKTNKYLIQYVEDYRRGSKNLSAKFLERMAYTFLLLPSHPSVTQYSVIRFLSPLLPTS